MKGLFVKDIELMKQQKQFFIMVVVMGVILNLTGSVSVSFAAGYFTIVTAIFAITTISYDEFDNGLAFLMTLPVTRKQYVAEKYLLGAGLTAVAWGIATITGVICKGVAELQGCLSETIIGSLIYIPLALLMLAVSLPLVIHFGAEKGRYIAMVMWAIIFVFIRKFLNRPPDFRIRLFQEFFIHSFFQFKIGCPEPLKLSSVFLLGIRSIPPLI